MNGCKGTIIFIT